MSLATVKQVIATADRLTINNRILSREVLLVTDDCVHN
jgi:hypothetical protein